MVLQLAQFLKRQPSTILEHYRFSFSSLLSKKGKKKNQKAKRKGKCPLGSWNSINQVEK